MCRLMQTSFPLSKFLLKKDESLPIQWVKKLHMILLTLAFCRWGGACNCEKCQEVGNGNCMPELKPLTPEVKQQAIDRRADIVSGKLEHVFDKSG